LTRHRLITQLTVALIDALRENLSTIPDSQDSSRSSLFANLTRFKYRNIVANVLKQSLFLGPQELHAMRGLLDELPEHFGNPYRFTAPWFENNIIHWMKDIGHFAGSPGLRFLEVGCYEGLATCWLLENILTHDESQITCIDSFDFGGQGDMDMVINEMDHRTTDIQSRFDHNIRVSGNEHKVEKIIDFSQIALRSLPLSYYDFVYIDGSHKAVDVLEDAVLAWRLLKEGGILTFDDYRWEGALDYRKCPKIAIDAFLEIYASQIAFIRRDYQVTIKKVAEDSRS
jgi:predicted O-methyltransferase YrrM